MTDFVLDNSVCIRWYAEDGSESDRQYAGRVLDSMVHSICAVPNLWQTEVISVLLSFEKRGTIDADELFAIISSLNKLPIEIDASTHIEVMLGISQLARAHNLSGYDAAYLELAQRMGIPLATLDKKLRASAKRAGIGVYLDGE